MSHIDLLVGSFIKGVRNHDGSLDCQKPFVRFGELFSMTYSVGIKFAKGRLIHLLVLVGADTGFFCHTYHSHV